MRRLLVGTAAIALLACHGCTAPEPTATGLWGGEAAGLAVSLALVQVGSNVSGSGMLSATDVSVPLSVNGTITGLDLSLTLDTGIIGGIALVGRLRGDRIIGTLNGQAFSNHQLTLTRD